MPILSLEPLMALFSCRKDDGGVSSQIQGIAVEIYCESYVSRRKTHHKLLLGLSISRQSLFCIATGGKVMKS